MPRSVPRRTPTALAASRPLLAGASLLLAMSASGCSAIAGITNCTDELRVRLSPADTTLAVGRSFTPGVALSSCGGRERLTDTFTYESTNVAAATVEPSSGRVTAVGGGTTDIVITGRAHGNVGRIRVTVPQ